MRWYCPVRADPAPGAGDHPLRQRPGGCDRRAIFNRANALAQYRDIAEGMVVPSTLVLEESERLAAFRERYRQKYGHDPDIWAVQGYDMVRMIADTAARLGTTDPARIAEALHEPAGYQGAGRLIQFEQGGALVVEVHKLPILVCRMGSSSKRKRGGECCETPSLAGGCAGCGCWRGWAPGAFWGLGAGALKYTLYIGLNDKTPISRRFPQRQRKLWLRRSP